MTVLLNILIFIILAWAFIYTVSYGRWTWKQKNKLGAVMIYILAVVTVALPIYALYMRQK